MEKISETSEGINTSYFDWEALPPELFMHICSFLSAKFLINVLSKVCARFKTLIEPEITWRMRIMRRWPKQYPIIPVANMNWKEACIDREEHFDLWKNVSERMEKFHIKEAHFGSVNVVCLLEENRLCASGGRDGNLKLWNVGSLTKEEEVEDYQSCLLHSVSGAHANAWIWSITYESFRQHLYSGGFDSYVREWDINFESIPAMTYKLSSPILGLAYSHNSFATGCYGRSVHLFDPRAGEQAVLAHIHHKKPVVCVSLDERFIISASEDKSVIIYDIASRKILNNIKFNVFQLSMSYEHGQLLTGDVKGSFHVIDPPCKSYTSFDTYGYETGHTQKITGIQHSLGSIITCSTDKTIRILEPNADPSTINILHCTSEISKISAYKTTLASANTDDSITIWKPKTEFI